MWTRFHRVCALLLAAVALPSMALARPHVQTDAELGFAHDTRADVLAHVKRVGVLSPMLLPAFTQREDLKAALQAKAADALRQAGFEVVGSEDYESALDRFIRQVGGIYDTRTGALKQQEYRTAAEYARREFADKDHLDGFVYLVLRATSASFNNGTASWDGARDRSAGPHVDVTLSGLLTYKPGGTGTLPAYSLLLQIANTENQVVFGRLGGIQLASYHTALHPEGGDTFRDVPPENLFRDEKRIERAIHIAVVPLLHSAEEIAAGENNPAINAELLGNLPPQPQGVFPQPASPFKVPRDEILAKTHRVVLTELFHPGFPVSPEVSARYLGLIREELKPLGWEIIQSDRVSGALVAALGTSSGFFDPVTGAADTARIAALRKSAYAHLGIDPLPDAILFVQLVPTVAQFHQKLFELVVHWDGVVQSAGTVEHCYRYQQCKITTNGSVRALSLQAELRSAEDVPLYQARGGVQLLQVLKGQVVDIAPTELFQDPSRDQPAVHAALRELALTPEQIRSEQQPPPKAH
jgi:hypothetical protein